jgi:hypothetical protein
VEGEEKGGVRIRVIEGASMIELYYMHIWKCRDETPYSVQLMYANTKCTDSCCAIRIIFLFSGMTFTHGENQYLSV